MSAALAIVAAGMVAAVAVVVAEVAAAVRLLLRVAAERWTHPFAFPRHIPWLPQPWESGCHRRDEVDECGETWICMEGRNRQDRNNEKNPALYV